MPKLPYFHSVTPKIVTENIFVCCSGIFIPHTGCLLSLKISVSAHSLGAFSFPTPAVVSMVTDPLLPLLLIELRALEGEEEEPVTSV